jgi:hypothetical protein
MSFKKANYKFGQRVKIKDTEGDYRSGFVGVVSGIASIHWYDTYIITLDTPYNSGTEIMPIFQTLIVPEVHLEPTEDKE